MYICNPIFQYNIYLVLSTSLPSNCVSLLSVTNRPFLISKTKILRIKLLKQIGLSYINGMYNLYMYVLKKNSFSLFHMLTLSLTYFLSLSLSRSVSSCRISLLLLLLQLLKNCTFSFFFLVLLLAVLCAK